MTRCRIVVSGRNNRIVVSEHSEINYTQIDMQGGGFFEMGRSGLIRRSKIFISDLNSKVTVGDYFGGGEDLRIICQEGRCIRIGNNFLCSINCELRNSDAHAIYDSENKRINEAQDIEIGNHVWLGENVKILKGVIVSDESVIGHSALLTRGFYEGNAMYGGMPAKKLKDGIHWTD